jgi:hypothetical protein
MTDTATTVEEFGCFARVGCQGAVALELFTQGAAPAVPC